MKEEEWKTCEDPRAMMAYLFPQSGAQIGLASEFRPSERRLRLAACATMRLSWHLLSDRRARLGVVVAEQFADGLVGPSELRKAAMMASGLLGILANSASKGPYSQDTAMQDAIACTDQGMLYHSGISFMTEKPYSPDLAAMIREVVGNPWHADQKFDDRYRTPIVLSLAQAAYEERPKTQKGECPRCERMSVGKLLGCPDCQNRGYVLDEGGTLCPVRLGILADALEEAGHPTDAQERQKPILRQLRECPCGDDRYARSYCMDCEALLVRLDQLRAEPSLLTHLRSAERHVRGCWALDLVLGRA